MKTKAAIVLALCALSPLACNPARAPQTAPSDYVALFDAAELFEQQGDSKASLGKYLDLLDLAVADASPDALATVAACLDAVGGRRPLALGVVLPRSTLSHRSKGGVNTSLERLEKAYSNAKTGAAVARPLIALTALSLAMESGNSALARTWRTRSGCVRHASIAGPTDWAGLQALSSATDLDRPGTSMPSDFAGIAPFQGRTTARSVRSESCSLDLHETSSVAGLRLVFVDVQVPHPQLLTLSLASNNAASVTAGGALVLRRDIDEGGLQTIKIAKLKASAGKLRVLVRVAERDDGDSIVLSVVGQDGLPLGTSAPNAGEKAESSASTEKFALLDNAKPGTELLYASASLALGESRKAERILEDKAKASDVSAPVALAYARALSLGSVLPEVKRIERQRDACEKAYARMPLSWEASICKAHLAGQRRGMREGRLEVLAELERMHQKSPGLSPLTLLFESQVASQAGLRDRALSALDNANLAFDGSVLFHDLRSNVFPLTGNALVPWACADALADKNSLGCFSAHLQCGSIDSAIVELGRLRELRDSPTSLLDLELSQRIAKADGPFALRLYDAMPPGRRILSALGLLVDSQRDAVNQRLMRDLPYASDSPEAALVLRSLILNESGLELDKESLSLVEQDRATPKSTDAATLVIRHSEEFSLTKDGLLLYRLHDLRRVSGTADVDEGADTVGLMVEGRESRKVVRRRVYKRDGRIVEPDSPSRAAQEHADLSQLEQGDYVEQVIAGLALPGSLGQLVVDTPDLLPQRTSVVKAWVELRIPHDLNVDFWAHSILGKAEERRDGNERVLRWKLEDRAPRRLEAGIPKMDQQVAVSFGTQKWETVGRSVGEVLSSMLLRDPKVLAFAKSAAGNEKPSLALLTRVIEAVGKKVKVASGASLTDSSGAFTSGGQANHARSVLELGQGSRTLLAYEMFRALGIDVELVVAEDEPFSSDPNFPAHYGRFSHPLLIAHLPKDAGGDIWIDLDVQGPPLPAGRVTAGLRGRYAIRMNGQIVPVVATHDELARDDIAFELAVDPSGNAKGSMTVVLRGREAQVLADAFEEKVGADRLNLLRAVVLAWLPWADVEKVELTSREGAWEVALRAEIGVMGFAQPEGALWVVPGIATLHGIAPQSSTSTLGATFAAQGGRENALAIETAFHYRVKRRIQLPPGSTLSVGASEIDVKSPHFQAQRTSAVNGSLIEEEFTLSVLTGTVDTSEFDDFASKARSIDDSFLSSIRVKHPVNH